VIRHEQAGGGGYGNPLERDLDLVERDLLDGKVTPAFAEQYHGVVIDNAGKVDHQASAQKRQARS
jgi:N-methylhydantoinase B